MTNPVTDRTRRPPRGPDGGGRTAEFEAVYRECVGAVTAYFARRTGDPQLAGDLTADTFVEAIEAFGTFDPARGGARAWLFGIARNVHAQHCARRRRDRDGVSRLSRHRDLGADEIDELLERVAAQRPGRMLLDELDELNEVDREAVDLVHIAGLSPQEAALAMGVSPGALRVRLFRVRRKLRVASESWKEGNNG